MPKRPEDQVDRLQTPIPLYYHKSRIGNMNEASSRSLPPRQPYLLSAVPKDKPDDVPSRSTKKTFRQKMLALAVLVTGVLLLIVPLWMLSQLSTEQAKLITISILVSAFVCLLGICTGAQTFETLAAAAAYTAVLVVFLKSSNNGN